MYRMRSWSTRNARWLKRLDKPFAAIEKVTKGFLLDSQNCGQCIVGFTGLSCPMNCPKKLRNGPCGGVRSDGTCEVDPGMAFRQEHRVAEIVERSGVLGDREPWRPRHEWEELAPADDEVVQTKTVPTAPSLEEIK